MGRWECTSWASICQEQAVLYDPKQRLAPSCFAQYWNSFCGFGFFFFVPQASLAFVAVQGSLFSFFKGVCSFCLNISIYLTVGSPALFY
ncbi:hypothetical protein Peur_063831 [Populus x canadensis]